MKARWLPIAVTVALLAGFPPSASGSAKAAGAQLASASVNTTAATSATAVCGTGTQNPTTNNVTDYRLDTNVVAPGRWSYLNLYTPDTPSLLVKGGTGAFAADEWAADLTKPEHAWYVKADGSIGTDDRPIAEAYSVSDAQDGKTLHIKGTFTSPGGRFRILQTTDGDSSKVLGPYTSLFDYTGVAASFDLTVKAALGQDLLFVSDKVSTWWVAGKLGATITTENAPTTAAVSASPDAGSVKAGTPVTLTSATNNACISYTTDGSDPLTSATKATYTAPIAITADTDLKAVAVADNYAPSAVADLTYVLSEPFRAFAGENQGALSGLVANIQWDRMDVDWNTIEPSKGTINQAALDEYKRQFTEAKSHGITILPVLGYTAGWAANRTGYSYTLHDQTFEYGPVTAENGDKLTRQLVTKDATGKVLSTETVQTSAGRTPPASSADWTSYVNTVIAALKPLGITYYQVWNEAYPTSGFWTGGMDQYMQLIHLPAVKVIHDAGAKVVYGGWICGAPLSEYVALLDKYDAWKGIDVFDMHYMPVGAMDTLYQTAKERGVANPAVWQTELGFTTQDKFIADVYPRVFHWALSKGGTNLDQFKLIYFAAWSPNDPAAFGYNRTLIGGSDLTPKGKTLTTLANLLRGSKAKTYDAFTTSPGLKPDLNENLSTANGFLLDDRRIVLAIDLKRQNDANIFQDATTGDTLHLDFGNPMMTITLKNVSSVKKLERVDLYGNRIPLTWKSLGGGRVQVQVPIIDADPTVHTLNQKENEDIFYLALQQG
ncbi:MAG: hypothetical protein QOH50_969 [Kribbellaceae bacterium]|nr:hypothetical protein [Kribbellaceae bacterium]